MHIPDGYLSPQTYFPFFGFVIFLWARASRVLGKTLKTRQVPLLAIGSAFSFVIMMFNIPVPGGTTGHAVGGVAIAAVLGPWSSFMAISIVIIIQALFFGDGGITAIGANTFNNAFISAFAGYYLYHLFAMGSTVTSRRRWVSGVISGYITINLSALATALELGIQPLIAKDSGGTPLYAPFPLEVTIPAVLLEHLILFGFIEGIITALIIVYFQRTDPGFLSRVT